MPFVHRQSIDSEICKPHNAAYKAQLREALLNPGLSANDRKRIKDQLAGVGQGKVYRAATPPKPGAIVF